MAESAGLAFQSALKAAGNRPGKEEQHPVLSWGLAQRGLCHGLQQQQQTALGSVPGTALPAFLQAPCLGSTHSRAEQALGVIK